MPAFTAPLTARIVEFLESIGLEVQAAELPGRTFLPGILIEQGRLLVDENRLRYSGDLLHEAGHLAVKTPSRRARCGLDASKNMGDEIGAIGWSYAALTHLGLDPAVVFHPHGYKGSSQAFLDNFREGRFAGVPLLQWMGLTLDEKKAREQNLPPYPHMQRWLREEPEPEPPAL